MKHLHYAIVLLIAISGLYLWRGELKSMYQGAGDQPRYDMSFSYTGDDLDYSDTDYDMSYSDTYEYGQSYTGRDGDLDQEAIQERWRRWKNREINIPKGRKNR